MKLLLARWEGQVPPTLCALFRGSGDLHPGLERVRKTYRWIRAGIGTESENLRSVQPSGIAFASLKSI